MLDKLLKVKDVGAFTKWWNSRMFTKTVNKELGTKGKIKFKTCRTYTDMTTNDIYMHLEMDIEANERDYRKIFGLIDSCK